MNTDEIKSQLIWKYPDINFTEFSLGKFDEKENYSTYESKGESKIDKEITTFYFGFVSNDFNKFNELSDIFNVVSSYIGNWKYHFGEIGFFRLDNLNISKLLFF